MIQLNDNFSQLPAVYLFTKISRRLAEYQVTPDVIPLIRMDIGDIRGPLPEAAATAMKKAIDDLRGTKDFKGYGPEQGYAFLRETIAENDYIARGLNIKPSEIFVSDGAKCDLGNLGDIFSRKSVIAVMNPSYPAYIDDNVIDGRAGKMEGDVYSDVVYLSASENEEFMPPLPDQHVDIIYLCSPNNPTGTVLTRSELKKWVDYAREEGSLIIFDSAYEAYIRDESLPKSVYEIEGAEEVAIEVRSFSKTGGFTGVRCGYTVVPDKLTGVYSDGSRIAVNKIWSRRQTTKFNGASYISQRGAEALYSSHGKRQVREMTDGFISNANKLKDFFTDCGWKVFGGINSPYVWARHPEGKDSVEVFEEILTQYGVSTTPGSGFGTRGQGFIRLTGFNTPEATDEAIARMKELKGKK